MSNSTSDYSIAEPTTPGSGDDLYDQPSSNVSAYSSSSSESESVHTSPQDAEDMSSHQTKDSSPAKKPTPTQDPAPRPLRRTNRLSQKSIQNLLLEVSGLPIMVWHDQQRQWISPLLSTYQMRSQIRIMTHPNFRETFSQELLSAAVHRQTEDPEYPEHACFGCAVLLGDRTLCSNDEFSTTACTECVASRQPCGQLCELPGEEAAEKKFALGFLPLPEEWRDSAVGSYYVRAVRKVEPGVSKGKEREGAVWW